MNIPFPVTVTGELVKTREAAEQEVSEKTLKVIVPKGPEPVKPDIVATSDAVTEVEPVGARVTEEGEAEVVSVGTFVATVSASQPLVTGPRF